MLGWVGCLEPPDLASSSVSEGRGGGSWGMQLPQEPGRAIFSVCFSFSLLPLASAG